MSESKIVAAIERFKADYAWDKSLITPSESAPNRPALDTSYGSNYLEEFMRSEQAKQQQDKL